MRALPIAGKDHYANGEGSVVAIEDYPLIAAPRLAGALVERPPVVENNFYYENRPRCGIAWQWDKERRITILYRVGRRPADAALPVVLRLQARGPVFELVLESGDLVFMCGKANGKDWDTRKGWTLRHATGAAHAVPKTARAQCCGCARERSSSCVNMAALQHTTARTRPLSLFPSAVPSSARPVVRARLRPWLIALQALVEHAVVLRHALLLGHRPREGAFADQRSSRRSSRGPGTAPSGTL